MLDGYVYSNVKNIDWVKDTEYILGKQVGEIRKQTNKSFGFNDCAVNVLPVGTKIHETNSPIVVAVVNGEEIPYLKMIEG
ncbi:hypothetical protein [Bacillus sp. JJ1474]|uniref:hypothetical protein n=1 Tax=Bacillus sp. JJ1474 TaxID=3122955 RepID=UPI002FFDAA18